MESFGHIDETPDLSPFAGLDLPGTFSERWFAGQAALVEQLGGIVGRPVTADDVEPLTWAMVEEGRRVTGPANTWVLSGSIRRPAACSPPFTNLASTCF